MGVFGGSMLKETPLLTVPFHYFFRVVIIASSSSHSYGEARDVRPQLGPRGLHGNMFNCASLTSDNAAAATLDEVGKSLEKEIELIRECINKNLTEHPGVILGDPGGLPQA